MGAITILAVAVALACLRPVASVRHDVYIVVMEGEPVVSYQGGIEGFVPTAEDSGEKIDFSSDAVALYSAHLEKEHDALLEAIFTAGTYKKLYSYSHLFNGFAVHTSPEQAEALRKVSKVKQVEKDMKVKKLTTHTPKFLGLPTGAWSVGGGSHKAGDNIVIGLVDSGIYPGHPSFTVNKSETYEHPMRYRGKCEHDLQTGKSFCNGKIVGAQHFASAAIASGQFNPSTDFASPLDGNGHGSHTAAIAAGKNDIPVRMYGHEFGKASGMAPGARIAVYKAIYRNLGGFVADVLAAIEQAVKDGVDILNLSVGLNSPSTTTRTTFLNPFDMSLLVAVKAGVFVAQAVGNTGPYEKSLVSYSPWVTTVAAAIDDRRYKNYVYLRHGKTLSGIGLSPSTHENRTYKLVAASDVMLDSQKKYSASDCQNPEYLDKKLVEGNILICGFSFNFVMGYACIKKVSETAKNLGAAGFILIVQNASPETRFDPVPVSIPGILISEVETSKEFIFYYNSFTKRDWAGRVTDFTGEARIGNGLGPVLYKSAPLVALFSSRGPDVKDVKLQDVDVLKPDILAPGSLIWAAWSINGTDEANYMGEAFAMISGSSMAAPHIAGIAALIKQKHPHWSPAAIKSALMTSASTLDRSGKPILAQYYSDAKFVKYAAGNPFDYGAGAVNPKAALDPGLIFDSDYYDYIHFICSVPGIDVTEISSVINTPCNTSGDPANLNLPSVAVSHLEGTRTLTRTVTNVAETETYIITSKMQPGVALEVMPAAMTLKSGASHQLKVTLTPRSKTERYNFGEIVLKGSRRHKVRIPVVAMC